MYGNFQNAVSAADETLTTTETLTAGVEDGVIVQAWTLQTGGGTAGFLVQFLISGDVVHTAWADNSGSQSHWGIKADQVTITSRGTGGHASIVGYW